MTPIRVGDAEIRRTEEKRMAVALNRLVDEDFIAANLHWLAPNFYDPATGDFQLLFQTWTIRAEGKIIVVDPCNGNNRQRPLFPHFHELDTDFLVRFTAAGIDPDDVDYVFCTHLHCDHCGWSTQQRAGQWVPTFPNARYLFVRREYERWDPQRPGHDPIAYNVGVFEDSVQPIVEAGLADLTADTHDISPALRIEPAYGHTRGHSLLRLASAGAEALFVGDTFHHPVQFLRPEVTLGGCDDLRQAIATRIELIARAANSGALLIPAHFQAPHVGHIRKAAGGYRFEALRG
jgi:glyoxylase-like metal-dependent hydrolase (beta-lactamase superfamily II)